MCSDRDQIGQVLIRYATAIDRKDWPLFASCWADDMVADYGELGRFTDVGALTDVFRAAHDPMGPTYHRMSNFVIDVAGDGATVRSYFHAVLMLIPGDSTNWIDTVGHYDDVFVRTSDGWRISRRTVQGRAAADGRREGRGGDLPDGGTLAWLPLPEPTNSRVSTGVGR
jgi:3-phenylpropionate/cinnamic acid dioxygenase small subunit